MIDIAGLLILNRLFLDVKPDEVAPPTPPPTPPPKGIPPKFPTLFGDDPFIMRFPFFEPDPKFIVKDPKGRPKCGIGEKAIFDTNTNQYRCVPKLL